MNVELIGANAGKIWNALQNGALSSKALKKATKLKEADKKLQAVQAEFAREGKLAFCEEGEETIIALA